MPEFTVVSASDVGALALLTQYFADRETTFPPDQGVYRTTFPDPTQFLPPNGVFLLIGEAAHQTDGGELAEIINEGCGGIRRIDDSPTGAVRYEIKHLFLKPEARGKGWGRLMLDELERRAREFGADELVLDTNASLAAAASLYTRAGFESIPPYNDNPNATHWYGKQLSETSGASPKP